MLKNAIDVPKCHGCDKRKCAHNETFKIAYCAGLIPYLQSTRESDEDYRQYLAEMKKKK